MRKKDQECKENRKEHCLESQLFVMGLFALPAGWALWKVSMWMQRLLPEGLRGCLWDRWLHIYCPGCGGTRAVQALLRGKLLLALWYHPLVVYGAGLYLIFMGSFCLGRLAGRERGVRFHGWYLYAAIVILIVNCVLKNILRFGWGITLD